MVFIAQLVRLLTVVLLRRFFHILPHWLDHVTDAPVMHERVNAGSDRYFAWREAEARRERSPDGWQVEDEAAPLRVKLGHRRPRLPGRS